MLPNWMELKRLHNVFEVLGRKSHLFLRREKVLVYLFDRLPLRPGRKGVQRCLPSPLSWISIDLLVEQPV